MSAEQITKVEPYRQLTYPRVLETQIHPRLKDSTLEIIKRSKAEKHDSLLCEIMIFLQRFSVDDNACGEWIYINTQKRARYIQALGDKDKDVLSDLFLNFFLDEATYGLISPAYIESAHDKIINQLLLDLDSCKEFTDFNSLDALMVTNPINSAYGLSIQNSVILPDSPRHYYFAARIADLLKDKQSPKFAEIGAGYGGLIYFLKQFNPNLIVYDIDLPETLIVCFYFLNIQDIPAHFVYATDDLRDDSVNLIPSSLYKDILANAQTDMAFNMHSFSEMGQETVADYLHFIQEQLKPQFIYHQNSNFDCFPNSERHIECLARDFPIAKDYHKISASISPFICGSGRYREYLFSKTQL
ncbi:MAG: putative sugar O-methyltransferase [Bdellovibrionales bacterium]